MRWGSIVLIMGMVAAACGSSNSGSAVVGPSHVAVQFVQPSAAAFNGPIPNANATSACGRNKYGFIQEIQDVGVTHVKITKHYGPIIRLANGFPKQMEASGIVVNGSGGNTDLPFDHSFGGDFSMDIALGRPFLHLGQNAGTTGTGTPKGELHVEMQLGEFPHYPNDPLTRSIPASMVWPAYARAAESSVIPGFTPQKGDAMAVQGDWILDCGHPDFHSELHETTFMAFGRDQGSAAVVHTFYNPYLPSELYNADAALAPQINHPANLTLPTTQPLVPGFLINTILKVMHTRSTSPIKVPMLVGSSTMAPAPFTVCPPGSGSGSKITVAYAFDVRPGVSVSKKENQTSGCTTFTIKFSNSYRTPPPAGQTLCPVPWGWLNQNAGGYAKGGTINLKTTILQDASAFSPSSAPAITATLQHRIRVDCFAQMSSPIGPVSNTGQTIRTVTSQLLPIVGWVKVDRT
ncbi:MAG: hypothetical protein ACYDGY_10870 [Acidimicrobiales bacterium]